MKVDIKKIIVLREETGAGMLEVKEALEKFNGDVKKARDELMKKAKLKAESKSDRNAGDGLIHAYVHNNGKVGSMVFVACETDFVARNPEFQDLVKDLALQIAGADPPAHYVYREDIPAPVLEKEREIFYAQARALGKPDKVLEQIVQGKIEKFYTESCLWEQPFIKDPEMKVRDLVSQKIAKMGENIRIRRFTRYHLGKGA